MTDTTGQWKHLREAVEHARAVVQHLDEAGKSVLLAAAQRLVAAGHGDDLPAPTFDEWAAIEQATAAALCRASKASERVALLACGSSTITTLAGSGMNEAWEADHAK